MADQDAHRPGPDGPDRAPTAVDEDRTDRGPAAEEQGRDGGPTAAELENRWRRAAADLDNLRKRHRGQLVVHRAAERDQVAAAFLPVVDNLELALRHAEADPAAIVDGVRAVREQALDLLAALGYPRQDEAGVPFDPARHEVVGLVPGEDGGAPPGTVAAVVRPGYGGPERQLRPAAVTVVGDPGS
jgi:molecular chaperone GrpE